MLKVTSQEVIIHGVKGPPVTEAVSLAAFFAICPALL